MLMSVSEGHGKQHVKWLDNWATDFNISCTTLTWWVRVSGDAPSRIRSFTISSSPVNRAFDNAFEHDLCHVRSSVRKNRFVWGGLGFTTCPKCSPSGSSRWMKSITFFGKYYAFAEMGLYVVWIPRNLVRGWGPEILSGSLQSTDWGT